VVEPASAQPQRRSIGLRKAMESVLEVHPPTVGAVRDSRLSSRLLVFGLANEVRELPAACDTQLPVHGLEVVLDGAHRDDEARRDLPIRRAARRK
jgi:hypothetical protein